MSIKVGDLIRSKNNHDFLVQGAVYKILEVTSPSWGAGNEDALVRVGPYCPLSKKLYVYPNNDFYVWRFEPYREADWLDMLELG